MPDIPADPCREILSRTRGKASIVDLLIQSISLCVGLWFLDQKTIDGLRETFIPQKEFEREVYSRLKATDPQAAESFRTFSQVRLLEDTFQELFDYWVQFSGSKDRLRRFTEQMISSHFSRAYRPELAVPSWLERFGMDLLPNTGGTFYDGAAGAGGMALRMAQARREEDLPLQVTTEEADPLLFHLSVLRARMHGFRFQQSNRDSLRSPDAPPKADLSIMFPPLRGGAPMPVDWPVTCGDDWSYAYQQLEALNETGVGVCRIASGALFNTKNQAFREYLLERNVIDAIIALPKNSAPFWTSAPAASLVVFRKGRKRDSPVWMMELPPNRAGMQDGALGAPYGLLKSFRSIIEENKTSFFPTELDAANLSPQRYLTDFRWEGGRPPTLHIFVGEAEERRTPDTVKLREAAQVYRGINVAGLERDARGAGVLRLSDVQNGQICEDDIVRFNLSERTRPERYQIQKGDVLVSCKGKGIKLCAVQEDTPLLLSHDFLGIRPDPDKVDSWYLFYYLQSPDGQRALQKIQVGSSIPMIRAADLECLPLHYIPLKQQARYACELRGETMRIEAQLAALNASKQRAYERFYQKIRLEDPL